MEMFFLFFFLITISYSDDRLPIYLAALVPKDTLDGGCVRQSIQMAFDDVNKVPHLLRLEKQNVEFRLVPVILPVDESPISVINSLFQIYQDSNVSIMGTIGPPYKQQNELGMHFTLAYFQLQASYSEAIEPTESYFAFFFKNTPTILVKFTAARRLIDRYNWTRAAIIYDLSDKTYRKNIDSLRKAIEAKNDQNKSITVLSYETFWSQSDYAVSEQIGKLQVMGARIIIAMVSIPGARKIFCEAFHRNMYWPKVTWILFETLPFDWASTKYDAGVDKDTGKPVREIDCSEEELLSAAYGYISIAKQKIRRDGKRTISNMTAEEFRDRLHNSLKPGLKCPDTTAYAYDIVWAMASSFNRKFKRGLADYNFDKYHTFFHKAPFYGDLLRTDLPHLNFEGITGPLKYAKLFTGKYDRIGQLSISSNKYSSVVVGMDDNSTNTLIMNSNAIKILFENGNVPKDEAIYATTFSHFTKPLFITMWIISCIGIVLALLFLLVTITFVIDKNIVMQSPGIHCVIILGSVLCYTSVIIYGLDTRFTPKEDTHYVCWAFLFTLSTGFTLTFGSLFAKTWQLYKLYMTPEVKAKSATSMKNVSDCSLLAIIGLFLFIDSIILINWVELSPFEYDVKNITSDENLFEDIIVVEQIVGCWCKYETEFTIGMYCYKGVILVFGMFLAWQTRNGAKIKIQNESKQIAMAIYNVVAVSVIGVICVSVLTNTTRHHATYAIVAVCICICTTTTLLLVFVPQIRMVLNSGGFSLNSSGSIPSAAIEPDASYAMGYVRKSLKEDSTEMKSAFSTSTMTSDISLEQCGSLDSTAYPSGSNSSNNPSYLSNSMFVSPPLYVDESKRYVDSNGHLSSGIYVGRIDEEPESQGGEETDDNNRQNKNIQA